MTTTKVEIIILKMDKNRKKTIIRTKTTSITVTKKKKNNIFILEFTSYKT